MNIYNGEIYQAQLVVSGSKRGVHIVSHADVSDLPIIVGVVWYTAYAIFDQDSGQQIGDIMFRAHNSAPWNTEDSADEDFVFWLEGSNATNIQVEMYCSDGKLGTPGGILVLCDIATIGNWEEPSPPPPEEFPWKWIAVGSGVAVLAVLLLRR